MFKRKDAGRFRRKPRAITSIPTRSLSKSGEGWENKVYKFKRSFLLSNDSADNWKYGPGCITPGYNPIDLTVMLDKLPNYTDFTTLFDSYRSQVWSTVLSRISTWVKSSWPAKHASGSAGDRCGQGRQHFAHRLTAAMQYASMEESLLDKERKRFFVLCPPSRPTAPLRQPATSLRMLPSGLTWPRRMSRTTVQRV